MARHPVFQARETLAAALDLPSQRGRSLSPAMLPFGLKAMDQALGGGLAAAAVHEFYPARHSDTVAATGLAFALATRRKGASPILWVRQDYMNLELGQPYAAGLAMFGIDPARIFLVKARNSMTALKVGTEAARCAALALLVLELWGEPGGYDLTASRRLFLAAKASGVTILVVRAGAAAVPSAAETRWQVAARPSLARPANALGNPAFAITLLRHRSGLGMREWCVEWNRDQQCFSARQPGLAAPVSQPVVSLPANRSFAAPAEAWQRAG
jgi:protein ImuA